MNDGSIFFFISFNPEILMLPQLNGTIVPCVAIELLQKEIDGQTKNGLPKVVQRLHFSVRPSALFWDYSAAAT
jgi:hypothetical protein